MVIPELIAGIHPGDLNRLSSSSTLSMSHNTETTVEVNYDENPTKLYILIQQQNWRAVVDRVQTHRSEASTWVYRMEKNQNTMRWRILPIHAALVFKADVSVVEALVIAYPNGVQQSDDQGMTPLHLAFRNSANESIVNVLISSFPEALQYKDKKGRKPTDLILKNNKKEVTMRHYLSTTVKERDEVAVDIEKENRGLHEELQKAKIQIENFEKKYEEMNKKLMQEKNDLRNESNVVGADNDENREGDSHGNDQSSNADPELPNTLERDLEAKKKLLSVLHNSCSNGDKNFDLNDSFFDIIEHTISLLEDAQNMKNDFANTRQNDEKQKQEIVELKSYLCDTSDVLQEAKEKHETNAKNQEEKINLLVRDLAEEKKNNVHANQVMKEKESENALLKETLRQHEKTIEKLESVTREEEIASTLLNASRTQFEEIKKLNKRYEVGAQNSVARYKMLKGSYDTTIQKLESTKKHSEFLQQELSEHKKQIKDLEKYKEPLCNDLSKNDGLSYEEEEEVIGRTLRDYLQLKLRYEKELKNMEASNEKEKLLNSQINQQKKRIDALEKLITKKKDENDELKEDFTYLKGKLKHDEHLRLKLINDIGEIKAALAREIENQKKSEEEHHNQITDTTSENEALQSRVDTLELERAKLVNRLGQLDTDLIKEKKRNEEINEELNKIKEENDELELVRVQREHELSVAKARIEDLEELSEERKDDLDNKTRDNELEIEKLKNTITELSELIENLENQTLDTQSKSLKHIECLEDERYENTNLISNLKDEVESLSERLSTKENEVEELNILVENEKHCVLKLTSELDNVRADLFQEKQSTGTYVEKINELFHRKNQLENQISQLKTIHKLDMIKAIETSERAVSECKKSSETVIEDLKNSLEEEKGLRANVIKELEQIQEAVVIETERNNGEVQQLKSLMADMSIEKDFINEKYEDQKTEYENLVLTVEKRSQEYERTIRSLVSKNKKDCVEIPKRTSRHDLDCAGFQNFGKKGFLKSSPVTRNMEKNFFDSTFDSAKRETSTTEEYDGESIDVDNIHDRAMICLSNMGDLSHSETQPTFDSRRPSQKVCKQGENKIRLECGRKRSSPPIFSNSYISGKNKIKQRLLELDLEF